MPRLAPVPLPEWAERAQAVLGGRPGLAVVIALRTHRGWRGQKELIADTSLAPTTLSLALRTLEEAGVVQASVAREERLGRSVAWRLDATALSQIIQDVTSALEL